MAGLNLRDRRVIAGIVAAGAIGLAVTFTGAPSLSPEREQLFKDMDANGDGFITRNEAWADRSIERRFALADRNQDGKLDRAEFQELFGTRGEQAK
jgi:Ca2+-binding EF-hand superfamily protein